MKAFILNILIVFLFTQCRDEDHGIAEKQRMLNDTTIKELSKAAIRGASVFENKCTGCHCPLGSHCEIDHLPSFVKGSNYQKLRAFILKPELFKKENQNMAIMREYNGEIMPDQHFKDSTELSDLVVFLKVHYR